MVCRACWMPLSLSWVQSSSKTKTPDPMLGIGRAPKNGTFSVSSLLSKHGFALGGLPQREARAFPPEPSARLSHDYDWLSQGVAPEAVGCLSIRPRGSELRLLVYACAKRIAIR